MKQKRKIVIKSIVSFILIIIALSFDSKQNKHLHYESCTKLWPFVLPTNRHEYHKKHSRTFAYWFDFQIRRANVSSHFWYELVCCCRSLEIASTALSKQPQTPETSNVGTPIHQTVWEWTIPLYDGWRRGNIKDVSKMGVEDSWGDVCSQFDQGKIKIYLDLNSFY